LQAALLQDVPLSEGEDYLPGQVFTKSWIVRNDGSCTWEDDFRVVLDGGELGAIAVTQPLVNPGFSVAPGADVEITLDLAAPESPGYYRGNFKLQNGEEARFGMGPAQDGDLIVNIQVLGLIESDPQFSMAFEEFHSCDGKPYAIFRIVNKGPVQFGSSRNIVVDLTTDEWIFDYVHNQPFIRSPQGCPPGATFLPGSRMGHYLGADLSSATESGREALFIAVLCEKDDLRQLCIQRSEQFTIP
jgi:hypothetical protein